MKKILMIMAAVALTACCKQNEATVKVADFGLSQDADNTEVFAAAMASAEKLFQEHKCRKVVTVNVPAGTYVTGTIVIPSGVNLHLESGAVIKGTSDLTKYRHLDTTRDLTKYDSGKGTQNDNCADNPVWTEALILVQDAERAAITGYGTIDGGMVRNQEGEEGMRGPHTILACNAKDFTMELVSVCGAGNYAILGYDLEGASFDSVKISGGWDGIHIRGCKACKITDCTFSTGDDSIAGGYWEGMTIQNCNISSSCNGIRMIMPSDSLVIKDCHFHGPCANPHITSNRTNMLNAICLEPAGWGPAPGDVEGVIIQDCNMENVFSPLSVSLGSENSGDGLTIENCKGTNINGFALAVKSWSGSRYSDVIMSNCSFEFNGKSVPDDIISLPFDEWPSFPSWGAFFMGVDGLTLSGNEFTLIGDDSRPVIGSLNCTDVNSDAEVTDFVLEE